MLYWGYNPLTNLLLTSWDILVWYIPGSHMVPLFWMEFFLAFSWRLPTPKSVPKTCAFWKIPPKIWIIQWSPLKKAISFWKLSGPPKKGGNKFIPNFFHCFWPNCNISPSSLPIGPPPAIFHQARWCPWSKGIPLPKRYLLGAPKLVWGRYNLIRLLVCWTIVPGKCQEQTTQAPGSFSFSNFVYHLLLRI